MNKKVGLFIIGILILFSFTSLANATSLGIFPQNSSIQLVAVCDNCTQVNLTQVIYPNGTFALLGDYPMTKNGTNYNYTWISTSAIGVYHYSRCGDLNGVLTCGNLINAFIFEDSSINSFEITPNGLEMTTAKSIGYIGFILILLFTFGLTVYGSSLIAWKHRRSDDEKIISVNNFRYLKVLLFAFAYFELMFLFGLSYKFFNEANILGFTEFFNFVYQWFLNLIFPLMIALVIIIFVIWITNKKLIKNLKLGI